MSREKQIDEMAKAICEHYVKGGCGRCPDCFCEGDALKLYNAGYRKQEWISVEERFPEEEGMYLCLNESGNHFEAYYSTVYDEFGMDSEIYDPYTLGFVDTEWHGYEVTHWMPLPEPPKGE